MKKILYILPLVSLSYLAKAQTAPTAVPAGDTDNRKVRFGLRVNPQPTWLSSGDKNNTPSGSTFGFGFGLNMEFRFSEVVGLLTGIGGDFEGGKYNFRNDGSSSNYRTMYFLDPSNVMVAPKNGSDISTLKNPDNTGYELKQREVKTTYVTIPLILKLSTKEYNAFKYFGMFGLELGVRVKAQANDSYSAAYTYDNNGQVLSTLQSPPSQSKIDISKDAAAIPVRLGLNVGIGSEYRIAGTTSVFISVNYFRSFVNMYRAESKYLIYQSVPTTTGVTPATTTTETFKFIQQNLVLSALRINVGVMF